MGKGKREAGWQEGGEPRLGLGVPALPPLGSIRPMDGTLHNLGPETPGATGEGGTPTWHLQFISL